MAETGYLFEVIVVLLAAILSTLLFMRLRLGTVLGYLVAGAVIGPSGLALVTDGATIRALAELGVVFLLFTVGLELPLERIRVMLGRIFALGAAQVVLTTAAICGVALLAGVGLSAAVVIGAGLALSSTAIVLRILADRGELTSQFGRAAFGVLLVQDLMVGPFLVWVLALGQDQMAISTALGLALVKMVLAVVLILVIGRIIMRHVFWHVAAIREPELFAALTLLIVLAAGLLASLAGLSMAFGAFLAGMLLAETHYRHQVAAEIRPFRGLLLGLFFMTVGMSVNLALTWEKAGMIILLAAALLLGKAALLAGIARLAGLPGPLALHLGVLLSQGGEFAFVLLGAGLTAGIVAPDLGQMLIVVVAVTMMATPLLALLGRQAQRRVERTRVPRVEEAAAATEGLSGHVVVAGFGRVGMAVGTRLDAEGVPFIAIDLDPRRVTLGRQRGFPVYFGDSTRPEILAAVHVERARAVVVAVDSPKAALQLVAMLRYIFPELQVYARAQDDAHAAELRRAGADTVVPELVATGVALAGSILEPEGDLPARPQTP